MAAALRAFTRWFAAHLRPTSIGLPYSVTPPFSFAAYHPSGDTSHSRPVEFPSVLRGGNGLSPAGRGFSTLDPPPGGDFYQRFEQ
jgi:hypothetical protein